jgi:uncharacterized protein (DUF1778 family)
MAPSLKTPVRKQRLEARITREQKRLIERAAQLRGTSVTDFIVNELQEAATETIRNSETLKLRDQARDAFLNALLHPPEPNSAARTAMRRYKKRVKAY